MSGALSSVMLRVLRAHSTAGVLLMMAGCSASAPDGQVAQAITECSSPSIYGGAPAADRGIASAVVAVQTDTQTCTGALLSSRVVLTARHCVSASLDLNDKVKCVPGATDAQVGDDFQASSITVTMGLDADGASSVGAAIFHPMTNRLCDADIALLVLAEALPQVTPLTIASAIPAPNATVDVLGYGLREDQCAGVRYERAGVRVLTVGPAYATNGAYLDLGEFETSTASCQGDSGGPAIDPWSHQIVGIVNRGGACDAHGGHVFLAPTVYRSAIEAAFAYEKSMR